MAFEAAKLDKKARDALPDEHFAVPGKRRLPIHDERHTRLAWDMVDRTQGLIPAEKSAARRRILKRAKELGIDTSDWHKVKAMSLAAMALNIENDDDHPNKMPFRGVMTRVDEPSDEPPSGSGGRRVTLTQAAAEAAIPSLLGMAVNYQPDFSGHDPKSKIGIITSADIVGNAIEISGFIYAADFPEVAERIRKDKDILGFSFEAERIYVADPGSDPLEIVECVFTGAAILRKDKAAYQSTSLAANAEDTELKMNPDELKALFGDVLAGAMKSINDRLEKIESDQSANATKFEVQAAELAKKIEANKSTMDKVEPHAAALDSCAAAMDAAGVGGDATRGHAVVVRKMASSMRAEAAMGKIPHIFRDHDYPYYASADNRATRDEEKVMADADAAAAALAKAVEDAVKPLNDKLAAAQTQIADITAGERRTRQEPTRKTLSPALSAALSRANLTLPEGSEKLNASQVDAALANLNLDTVKRMQFKTELTRAGLLN